MILEAVLSSVKDPGKVNQGKVVATRKVAKQRVIQKTLMNKQQGARVHHLEKGNLDALLEPGMGRKLLQLWWTSLDSWGPVRYSVKKVQVAQSTQTPGSTDWFCAARTSLL